MGTQTLSQVHKRSIGNAVSGGLQATDGATWHASRIQAALSTQIIVQASVGDGSRVVVGAIQTLAPTETRPLVRISELGTDGVLQVVPNAAFTVELAVTRLVFDFRRLPAAFGRSFRHIHAQRNPFDIVVTDYNTYAEHYTNTFNGAGHIPDGSIRDPNTLTDFERVTTSATDVSMNDGEVSANQYITTRYVNCWLTSYSYTYDQSNYLITENATVWAETVIDENSPPPQDLLRGDALEAFFNQSLESNAMSTAFIGGRGGITNRG